jgi:hypothetical protein
VARGQSGAMSALYGSVPLNPKYILLTRTNLGRDTALTLAPGEIGYFGQNRAPQCLVGRGVVDVIKEPVEPLVGKLRGPHPTRGAG